MKRFLFTLIAGAFFLPALASAATISVTPENPIQGEPILITIEGLSASTTVSGISFESKKLGVFTRAGKPSALYGIDLNKKPADYTVTTKLSDGSSISRAVTVAARKKIEAPLGIPEKLGGNTPAAATTLVSTLAQENASLLNLRTGTHAFWTKPFVYPVANPVVTDEYGYSRQTVGRAIAHKGTDFRAPTGTKVLAMNRGVVRLVQEGRNYGKTIVVDHGLGLQTFYMHLSKIYVNEGELVLPGQTIGLSGMTGYAESPHLHTTVRLYDVSIDPMKFMAILK
ncbi:MAG TPA: M23 family metallopeptidase [Candidatus Paceibacterota bacterium]